MDVAEITALLRDRLDRTGWPRNMRVFVRRRRLAPGEKPALFHIRGYKYTAFVTNTTTLTPQPLDARHRAHARAKTVYSPQRTLASATCLLQGVGGE